MDGVGVYCKCGGIIYAITNDAYKKNKKEIDRYFDKGYKVGMVSKSQVQQLFGCKCKNKNNKQ